MRFNNCYIFKIYIAEIKKMFLSMIFVWAGNALFDLAIFAVFSYIFSVSYIVGQIISYVSSASVRYAAYSFVKLKRKRFDRQILNELPRFIVVSVVTLSLSLGLTLVFRGVLFWDVLITKLAVTAFTTTSNAFTYKNIIFSTNRKGYR